MLYYTMLYYTILYYTILYYTILHYTMLYYTTLPYFAIPYHNISYFVVLCGLFFRPAGLVLPDHVRKVRGPKTGLQNLSMHSRGWVAADRFPSDHPSIIYIYVYTNTYTYIHIYVHLYRHIYSHPEVDRIWVMSGIHVNGSFKDHIRSTAV